jgi:HEAT repeat protein
MILALHNDTDEPLDVRRRALEAIGNCGREGVSELILKAYRADELLMRVSALFAMGRSCDDVWLPHIVAELSSDYPEMRYEAARAAGELELRPALARLTEIAFEDDREIQEMAIWSLGEIGGKEANRALTQLAALADDTDDDVLADAIAEAQSVATLSGSDLLPLFDFSDFDDDEVEDGFLLSLDELGDEENDDFYTDDEDDDLDDDLEIDEPDELDADY